MDQAHIDRKKYLEEKGNLDENEKVELENIKKHEADVSGNGDNANANAGQAQKSKSEQKREDAQKNQNQGGNR